MCPDRTLFPGRTLFSRPALFSGRALVLGRCAVGPPLPVLARRPRPGGPWRPPWLDRVPTVLSRSVFPHRRLVRSAIGRAGVEELGLRSAHQVVALMVTLAITLIVGLTVGLIVGL